MQVSRTPVFLIFSEGREILSGDTGQGVTNILLSASKEALRRNLDIILQNTRYALGADRFRVVSLGYTGISKERKEFGVVFSILEGIFKGSHIILESDIVTSHAANFQGKPGIVLHAGTGAFAYGVDADGKRLRTGGGSRSSPSCCSCSRIGVMLLPAKS